MLELASDYIERAKGVIKGADQIVLDKKISIKDFSLYADDLSIKVKNLPGFITNFDLVGIECYAAFIFYIKVHKVRN